MFARTLQVCMLSRSVISQDGYCVATVHMPQRARLQRAPASPSARSQMPLECQYAPYISFAVTTMFISSSVLCESLRPVWRYQKKPMMSARHCDAGAPCPLARN